MQIIWKFVALFFGVGSGISVLLAHEDHRINALRKSSYLLYLRNQGWGLLDFSAKLKKIKACARKMFSLFFFPY